MFMLANDRVESMRLMYELFRCVDGGTRIMIETMSKYLRERGTLIINEAFGLQNGSNGNADKNPSTSDENPSTSDATSNNQVPKPITFVQSLIDLKDQFDRYLIMSFHEDRDFEHKIHSDFSYFMNLSSKSAEFLSRFIDEKLRKGSKSQTETEMEEALEKTLILFRFLQDKDLFEGFYKQHLAKRLLLEKNVSDDAEKLMISKLKTECGTQFTTRLEGMFRDMELSNQTMAEYRDRDSRTEIDISVRILSQLHWPISSIPPPCLLPRSADDSFQHFQTFYLNKHSGRKIQLNPALGTADVKAIFYRNEKKTQPLNNTSTGNLDSQQESDGVGGSKTSSRREETKILIVSTYQMVILLRFNHQEKITFEKLIAETQIPEKDATKALLSLSSGKQLILSRKGKGNEIDKDDEFSVNDNFTSKLTRIKIMQISGGRVEPAEQKDVRSKIDDDRKHEIEAAIVRVLKSRKKIMHNELIAEVTTQLKHRFMPDPTLIKKRIESLIERDYLDRDKNNQKQYNYIS